MSEARLLRALHAIGGWLPVRSGIRAIALVFLCCTALAQSEQRFEIRSAYIEPAEGVYQLNATLVFDLPDGAREAVREGAPLTLDLEIVLHRSRKYWLDETVANLEQHYELVYHALSERYLLRNVNSGEQASYATMDAALDSLRVVSNLPILDQSLVVPGARHEISLRAHLDVRTMPDALRFIVFWANDWRQTTEWYTWSPQI
ncbi:MAG TPA: DUF4390 domain-containing protein [Povalibacter sp.]|nr:DUF4390 domain-containing protein [Povalibacter sp.]